MTGAEAIAAERQRQIEAEGWTPADDYNYRDGDLAAAGASYALHAAENDKWRARPENAKEPPMYWPFDKAWWQPRDRRADLVRAGALIAAEIDRLDRMGPEA